MAFSDSDTEYGKLRRDRRKLLVPVVFITYVITKALDRVFIYRVQKSMAHYSTILMSIYWPPGICLACFCFLFLLNGAKSLLSTRGKDEKRAFEPLGLGWFSPVSEFASAQGRVPQKWFALIGFLDQINATFSAPPSVYIPVVLQTPLNNLVVGWVMLISLVYLKMSFKAVHYAGVVLILCSCIVGELVELQGPPDVVCNGLDTAREIFEDDSLPIPQKARWAVGNATEKCVRGLPPYKGADGRSISCAFWHRSLDVFALHWHRDSLCLRIRVQAEEAKTSELGCGLGLFLAERLAGSVGPVLHPGVLDPVAHAQWPQ